MATLKLGIVVRVSTFDMKEISPLVKAVFFLFVVILTISVTSAVASDFPSLVAKVPGSANTIMLIDADAILSSPVAVKGGWAKKFADGSADRPMYLPPEADKVVVGAQLDQVRSFARTWEVALMGMKEPYSMSLVARAEGGYVDTINGVNVAWVPSDAYFIEVDAKTLGLMAPANRQAIGRWADNSKKSVNGELSPYLKTASGRVGSGPQAILALDTTNAIQPHRVQSKLEASDLAKSLDVVATAQMISSMQGVVLEMTFSSDVQAVARIDFAVPVTLKDTVAKALVLQALDTMGMALPGTENWTCSVRGKSITMSGELETDSIRRVFSLMEVPTTKFSSLKDQPIEESSGDDVAKLSLAYFHSIDALCTDLKGRTKSNTSGDSHWVNLYATKIDKLPILHVDDDLLTYGEKLSETLRVMSNSRRMTNMQGASVARADRSSAGLSTGYADGYGYRNYGYTSPRGAEDSAVNATADATAAGSSVKLQGWTLIDEATVEIRRAMTKRYNVEF